MANLGDDRRLRPGETPETPMPIPFMKPDGTGDPEAARAAANGENVNLGGRGTPQQTGSKS